MCQGRGVSSERLDLFGEAAAERRPACPHLQTGSQRGGQVDQFSATSGRELGRHDNVEVAQK